MEGILTVSAVTEELRKALVSHFPFVWVLGEATNVSRAASGHIYFTLKDRYAQLQCVWFSRMQNRTGAGTRFDPLTGEVFENERPDARELLQNGREVICAGPIGIYAGRGQYQLQVEFVQLSGTGDLARKFEELKTSLAERGYFDSSRKRNLPYNPARVALITSPHGAAIHDFLRISKGRGLSSTIRLFPVPVQGEDAAPKVAEAIKNVNFQNWADLIVIIRGGGSLEDLWAFNEEMVATAIFNSHLPVLTGIGHEIDTTIADMTADARAATPSHAAQILWPDRMDIMQKIDELCVSLNRLLEHKIYSLNNNLGNFNVRLNLVSPVKTLEGRSLVLDSLTARLELLLRHRLDVLNTRLEFLSTRISSGKSVSQKLSEDWGRLDFLEGSLEKKMLAVQEDIINKVEYLHEGMVNNLEAAIKRKSERLRDVENLLNLHNPELPVGRGFSLLLDSGGLIKSVMDVKTGQKITALLADGELELKVLTVKEGRQHI